MTDDNRVIIAQYDGGSTLWTIRMDPDRLIPRRKDIVDWATCPGTLYQDYETREAAAEAARWWGFEPEMNTGNEPSDKEILDEIRACVKGWHLYLKNPPEAASPSYIAAVRACAKQIDAILTPEEDQSFKMNLNKLYGKDPS